MKLPLTSLGEAGETVSRSPALESPLQMPCLLPGREDSVLSYETVTQMEGEPWPQPQPSCPPALLAA